MPPAVIVRVATENDVPAVASLRLALDPARAATAAAGTAAVGAAAVDAAEEFERHLSEWLSAESDRRTTWLAELAGAPVGMASLYEYRRMPRPERLDSRWGYVGNMFVREDCRNRGIGSALLAAIISAATERSYVRLVVSPTERSVPFYRRAGFVDADGAASALLLMRPHPPSSASMLT